MFYDELKYWCEKKGVSPNKAGVMCGVSESAVSGWKRMGSAPRAETLNRLAEYFGISVAQLLDHTVSTTKTVFSGFPVQEIDPSLLPVDDGELVYRAATHKPSTLPDKPYVFFAPDNSMIFDCIPRNAELKVTPCTSPNDGEIVVVKLNGQVLIRRWQRDGDRIILNPSNPRSTATVTSESELRKGDNGVYGVVVKITINNPRSEE